MGIDCSLAMSKSAVVWVCHFCCYSIRRALHPFLLPKIVQERLAGRRVHVPVVFLVPAEDDSGSDYLFLGVEKARRYRGTYL